MNDIKRADGLYRSFPLFKECADGVIDTVRWDRYSKLITDRREIPPTVLQRARSIVKRAAAVDTGAIEGLYEVDRGFTFTVASEAAMWESVLDNKGIKVRSLIESQLEAYDLVLDAATQQLEITEAFIRRLHEVLCKKQETYLVQTEVGVQEQQLPLGVYKHLPNHVRKQDGSVHSYCPVEMVPSEMHRLCEEIRSDLFKSAHPVLQASFVHYALVVIHPFADGNGRVARALASIFYYRGASIPVMILSDKRGEYFASLEAADKGDKQKFIDFMLERALDAFRMVDESIEAASYPLIEDTVSAIKNLYVTRGGYTHFQVDEAGRQLLLLFFQEIQKQVMTLSSENLSINVGQSGGHHALLRESLRHPLEAGRTSIHMSMQTKAPASANVTRVFQIEIPKDCGAEDDLVIHQINTPEAFEARITELIPSPAVSLEMRISISVRRFVSEALAELKEKAVKSLRQVG